MFNFKTFQIMGAIIVLGSSWPVKAARLMIVVRDRAVVYADPGLTSPIGYLSKGKKIFVGGTGERKGPILPVSLNGVVAWMRAQDISANPELVSSEEVDTKLEHNVEKTIEVEEEDYDPEQLRKNNHLHLRVGKMSSPKLAARHSDLPKGDAYYFEEERKTGLNFSISVEHKNPTRRWHWGAGLDYSKVDSPSADYQVFAAKGTAIWVAFRHSLVFVESFASLLLSDSFKVKMHGLGKYSGSLYGLEYGVLARIFPYRRYGILVGLNFLNVRTSNLDKVLNLSTTHGTHFEKFTSNQLFVGLSYRL